MEKEVEILSPTPLFGVPEIKRYFGKGNRLGLELDQQDLLRATECILLPGEIIKVTRNVSDYIVEVMWERHHKEPCFFMDERFLSLKPYPHRTKLSSFSKESIIQKLRSYQGAQYIWGGNWSIGIPEMLSFYPPLHELDEYHCNIWTLKGVDCSGLLFEVMEGNTPRNTSQLVHFGEGVEIEGKTIDQMLSLLKPLDLVVWKGHVLIVLDNEEIIESLGGKGVIIHPLEAKMRDIMKDRRPVNTWEDNREFKTFVIRRGIEGLL